MLWTALLCGGVAVEDTLHHWYLCYCEFGLSWTASTQQSWSVTPLLSCQGRENITKASWIEVRLSNHSMITVTGKRDNTWGN